MTAFLRLRVKRQSASDVGSMRQASSRRSSSEMRRAPQAIRNHLAASLGRQFIIIEIKRPEPDGQAGQGLALGRGYRHQVLAHSSMARIFSTAKSWR